MHLEEESHLAPPPVAPEVPPAPANPPAETWISMARWCRENHAGEWREMVFAPQPVFTLTTGKGTLYFQVKSQIARWNGMELHLGFEPQWIDGQMFLHELDVKKNVEPLLRDLRLPAGPNRTIVIDPGHGGDKNTGTTNVVDGVSEKVFTLDWAKRLEPLLAAEGWQVFLTRTNDIDLSLSNRVMFAEEHHADLFISLHFNSAAPNQEQSGLETYCLTPAGMPSTLTRGYKDEIGLVLPNNTFDAENLALAVRVHQALLKVCGVDRGVRRARFLGVLRGQNRPAILVEGGYLSNPHEARRIADPAYREKLAGALARALAEVPESGSAPPAETSTNRSSPF